jgi:hypothetical protein
VLAGGECVVGHTDEVSDYERAADDLASSIRLGYEHDSCPVESREARPGRERALRRPRMRVEAADPGGVFGGLCTDSDSGQDEGQHQEGDASADEPEDAVRDGEGGGDAGQDEDRAAGGRRNRRERAALKSWTAPR